MKEVKTNYNGSKYLLINYTSSKLIKKDKVRFYYALKGRDGLSGILKLYNAKFLGKGVILLPFKHKEDIKSFLNTWKLPYTLREISMEIGEEVIYDEE